MATKQLPLNSSDKVLILKGDRRGQTGTVSVIVDDMVGVRTNDGVFGYLRSSLRKVTAPAKVSTGKSHKSKADQKRVTIGKLQGLMSMPREKAIDTVISLICQELRNR